MTGVMSGASAAMAAYLFTHPDVNAFFSGLQGLPKAQVRDETESYLAANPAVHAELEAIRSALIEGEASGEPRRFDGAAFKRRMQTAYG